MRFHLKKTETGYMSSKNKYFTDAQKNAMKLRDELAQHQLAGTEPPVSLTVELKMAELLLKLESIETISVKYKHKLTLYEMEEINPPEFLLKNLEDTKRQLEIISKSLE